MTSQFKGGGGRGLDAGGGEGYRGSGVCIVIYGAISWAAREFKPVEVWVCLDICGPVFGICVFECVYVYVCVGGCG